MDIFKEYLPIVYHGYYSVNQLEYIPNTFDMSNGYPYNVIDCSGSRANGKTINVIRALLVHMMISPDDIMIFRYIQKSIKQSSHATIINEIKQNGLEEYFDIKQNYIRCNLTGATINYSGLYGQEMNIRSLSPSYKVIIIEECANVTGELWDILLPTILRFERILVIPIYNITTTNNPAYLRFHEDKSKETLHIFGTIFDNKCVPEAMLKRAEKDKDVMSIEEWNMHYLGIPQQTLRNAIFSSECLDKLRDCEVDPLDYDKIIISLDPAVTSNIDTFDEEQKSNYSGICVFGYKDGICYGLDFIQLIESPDVVINKCIELYKTYKADYILYESNQGGDYIKSLILSKDNSIQVKSYRSIVDKMKRASMLVLPITTDRVKILVKDGNVRDLYDEMSRCTTVGYLKNFKADSPNLTDCFAGAIIDLLRLNQRGTVNTVLPCSDIFDDNLFHHSNILAAYNQGNIMYGLDISVKYKDKNTFVIVNRVIIDNVDYFTVDKKYDYAFLPNIKINTNNNLSNIDTIEKLDKSSNMLNNVKKVQINDDVLRDIWDNYNDDDSDDIQLQLLLYTMGRIN